MNAIDIDAAREAWEQAARELDVQVQTRDCWIEGDDGLRHEVIAIVHGFGNERGAVLFGDQHDRSTLRLAEAQGFFVSVIFPSHESYDRGHFEATLNDFGWYGPGDPPRWYTGEPWS